MKMDKREFAVTVATTRTVTYIVSADNREEAEEIVIYNSAELTPCDVDEEVTVAPTSTDSNLKSSKSQYAWSDDVSLWLTNALALTRGKKGKGLNLNPLYSDILYSDIWKVEATLVDAGIIGKAWHEAE
jgi:hypothetical protein